MPPVTYADIPGLNGAENPGGTAQRALYAPTSYFTTIQEPANMTSATTAAELAEISANHVFAVSKGFLSIYCTQGKGKGNFKMAAEVDAHGGFYEVSLFVPGSEPSTLGLIRKMKTDDLIFLLPMADGIYHQIGTTNFPAKVSEVEWDSAEQGTGVRGTMIKVRAFQMGPYKYTGTVTEI